VAGWLLAIARNAAIDAVRLARDQPYDPDVLVGMLDRANVAPPDGDPPEHLAEAERIRAVLRRLPGSRRLPSSCRRCTD
jgi:DNA-directed RNA polymerase specialized sigma24 family protein